MARRWTVAFWAAMLCACEDAERHELDGLVVVEDFDQPICAGTFSYFERRLAALERETGLARDPRGLVFHWLFEQGTIGAHCGGQASGCAPGRDFYADLWAFSHELTHAHLSRLGRPRVWFEEGMAVMFEEGFSSEPDLTVTPSELFRIDDPRGLDYDAAGAFTAYLRERYGMPKLLDYYAATDEADLDSAVAAFGAVFGDDFSVVEDDYLKSGVSLPVGLPDCDVTEVEWGGGTWSHRFALTCDDPASVGPQQPLDEPERPLLSAGVSMTAPAGAFAFGLEATGPAWVSFIRCDGPEFVFLSTDAPQTEVLLEGGRYLVSVDAYIDTGMAATVTARPLTETPSAAHLHEGPSPGFIGRRGGRRHQSYVRRPSTIP